MRGISYGDGLLSSRLGSLDILCDTIFLNIYVTYGNHGRIINTRLDICLDKMPAKTPFDISLRVETNRFGPFVFQAGLSASDLALALQRVEDAHERFVASPLSSPPGR